MKRTKVAGAMLATAVALAFTASAVSAGDAPSPSTQAAQIKCLGANECKGQSAQDCNERLPGEEFVQGQRLRHHHRRQILRGPGRSRRQESADVI